MQEPVTNPFDVQTPEHLSPDDFTDLFVDEGSDHYQIMRKGHTFLIGSRGVGKSMIFRLMEPDCLCRNNEKTLNELPFYGAYVPIKDTQITITELLRLEELDHAVLIFNEHLLVNHICSRVVRSLIKRSGINFSNKEVQDELRDFIHNDVFPLIQEAGGVIEEKILSADKSDYGLLDYLSKILDKTFSTSVQYLKRLGFSKEQQAYTGPLLGYKETLEPFIKGLKKLSFMPQGPFYILLDDADNLNKHQTKLINTWVAARTTGYMCLKISVQSGKYKTYQTITGRRIDSPHDFSDVDVTRIYTTNSGKKYKSWVEKIVERRLDKVDIKATPSEFFPQNLKQEAKIKEITKELTKNWDEGKGRGNKKSDDAVRYARPNYIRSLSGKSKNIHSYSYAGFEQLVHISSGVIRHFLEPISLMYSEAQSKTNGKINNIPASIQNDQIRLYSNKFLFEEFKHVEDEEGDSEITLDNPRKLKNLINGLGKLFQIILLSDGSERKKFSIAISDHTDKEVQEILDLGVQYGYFHFSTLGSKEGMGRVPLYILSRRLAPMFTLDPSSFAGYQFITNEKLKLAIHNPKQFIGKIKEKGPKAVEESSPQGTLFNEH